MDLICVVGARPNFMKVAAILAAAGSRPELRCRLVHTGQHYDRRMSTLFFEELGLPEPDHYLGVGSGNHAQQTAEVMLRFDAVLERQPADAVLVVGDVNSTIACALVAVKRGVPVIHVEAGLRSGDRTMPEEVNRVLTDQISDLLYTTEREAEVNLRGEGIPAERVRFVGNVMIDTLFTHLETARKSDITQQIGLTPGEYALCTLHRPSNVDTESGTHNLLQAIEVLARCLPVALPLHPRTRAKLQEFQLLRRLSENPAVRPMEPLGYLEFLALMDQARVVLTDSGGIQEETTALGVPCLTFRENTERPVTISHGTNRLVGCSVTELERALDEVLSQPARIDRRPELWDGQAAPRIVVDLLAWWSARTS
ncbi:MAG: non-hydrolyzing UDP-N-acetylglucosamine 2-epimerase [Armatimonadota bacterium]